MDPLSVAASVAGVATLAADLSKALYTIYHEVKGAEKETEEIASSVSILSTVLKALETVLRNGSQTYRPEFVPHVKGISDRCERIFKDIEAATGVKRGKAPKKSLLKKIAWCFQKDRVKTLQISLESLKSTLNILLHVISLAGKIAAVATNGETDTLGNKDVTEQTQLLTSLVTANRILLQKLDQMEVEAQRKVEVYKQQPQSDPLQFKVKISNPTDVSDEDHESVYQRKAAWQKAHDGQKQRAPTFRHDPNERLSPDKTLPGPSEPVQKEYNEDQRSLLHAASDGSHNPNEDSPRDNTRPPSLLPSRKPEDAGYQSGANPPPADQPSQIQEEAGHDDNSETRLTSSYAFELINGVLYTPRTSKLLRNAIPHEKHAAYPIRSSTTSQNQDERMVDRLLKYYTCVSVERHTETHESFPPRYHEPRPVRRNSDESTTFFVDRPEHFGGRAYHDRGFELIPRDMVPVDDMIQRMTFHQVEYYKLQEQNRNLEQELRFERAKEQIRRETLNTLKAQQDKEAESRAAVENSKPLTLKDCLGRSFSLPIQACRSWQTMRSLITSSFLHMNALSPQIAQGSYDLLGPTGDIILPEVWESMVQPGWVVELRLRPQQDALPESLLSVAASPRTSPQTGSISDGRGSGSLRRHRPSLRGWLRSSRSSKQNVAAGES